MVMKRPNRNKGKPVSDETRNVLDAAITNIVQALGSKASVLVFWNEKKGRPSHFSTYGLSTPAFDELRPLLQDLTARLSERLNAGNEELTALQSDINTQQGNMHVVALPIQAEGRFIAALCLFQPLSLSAGLPFIESHALPSASSLSLTAPGLEPAEHETGLIVDQGDLLARNARLLKRLVEEKEWWKAVVSHSPDGILIVDRECKIVGFNPAFTRLSGWTIEELRGQDCMEAFSLTTVRPGERCSMLCPLKVITPYSDDRRVEVVMYTKDGERRDVELSYSPILSGRGDILGSIIGARDITARKAAEELQNTFLSVVSHELQTPIAIIKGYAGFLADETTEMKPEQVREKMQIIEEESERLSKLVDNLLYASRIQAGGIELERIPVDLSNLIRRVVQKMGLVSKQHKLAVNLPEELPTVVADYDKIQEVLVNLLENAVKYSPAGGQISVDAEPTSSEVIIGVTDQGSGVPEGERQRIFDRFSRLDSRYVRERKGAGLGLYICKAIVEAHGGRIWVEAAAGTHNGSRFCFTLPREVPAQLPVLFGNV